MKRQNPSRLASSLRLFLGLIWVPLVPLGCDQLITGGNVTRSTVAVLWDTLTQRQLLFEKPVGLAAPNGRTWLTVTPTGEVRLYAIPTRQVLQSQRISPERYRQVRARWLDNRRVAIVSSLRYPALGGDEIHVIDRGSGKVTDSQTLEKAYALLRKSHEMNKGH